MQTNANERLLSSRGQYLSRKGLVLASCTVRGCGVVQSNPQGEAQQSGKFASNCYIVVTVQRSHQQHRTIYGKQSNATDLLNRVTASAELLDAEPSLREGSALARVIR